MSNAIRFNPERCTACTACVKICPTEAIRVVRSKAVIYEQRCIDCGRCVSTCPTHAFSVVSDRFEVMERYKYNIAVPDTALYGQFHNLYNINLVNEGLLKLGFDQVCPAAYGAELLSQYYLRRGNDLFSGEMPLIDSECPAAVRLIAMEYQDLIPNVAENLCSFEVSALLARQAAAEQTGLSPEEIGVGFISPCPAKNARVYHPLGLERRLVDYVLSISDVYRKLLDTMKTVDSPRDLQSSGRLGLSWGRTGGMSALFAQNNALAVDGMENVSLILSEVEDGKVSEAEFLEVALCPQSCFGGCLTVENPYTAKLRMRHIIQPLPDTAAQVPDNFEELLPWDFELEEIDTEIADSIAQALQIEAAAVRVHKSLPNFDCGNCGAPTCRAFSRDVAEGFADEGDCIFNIIRAMRQGKSHEEESDEFVPPPFRQPK